MATFDLHKKKKNTISKEIEISLAMITEPN